MRNRYTQAVPNGPGDILELIRHGRATTRGDVLELTGLSRMTVAQRLDALLAAAMVVEGETAEATQRSRSVSIGRTRHRCAIRARLARVLRACFAARRTPRTAW